MIPEINRILYTTDLSKNAAHAFRYAVTFAKKFDAEIIILHVIEELSTDVKLAFAAYLDKNYLKDKLSQKVPATMERIKTRLRAFCDKEFQDESECEKYVISIDVCKGYPEEEILKKVNELGCDAILMGAHEKGHAHTFLGSVAKRVLRRTRKPVFLIPLPEGETDITFNDI